MLELVKVILCILFALFVEALIVYSAHVAMTRNNTAIWGFSTWKYFILMFNQYQWSRDKSYRLSFFCGSEIHAGVIKFDNRGMVLLPISYIIFICWLIKNRYSEKSKHINWRKTCMGE